MKCNCVLLSLSLLATTVMGEWWSTGNRVTERSGYLLRRIALG